MTTIDLNADLGESVDGVPTADDEAMFALISSANIACGGHAGDAVSMAQAVRQAALHGVAVGAHPSYPDRAGFGRVAMKIARSELAESIFTQLQALADAGACIRYVKPHGALYHAVNADPEAAKALVDAVTQFARLGARARPGKDTEAGAEAGAAKDTEAGANAGIETGTRRERGSIPILGRHGYIRDVAKNAGLRFVAEAFLDRGYRADGTLVPRGEPNALLTDPAAAAARAVRLAREGTLLAVDGAVVHTEAQSLCLHGDSADAVAMARAVRTSLNEARIEVRAPW